MTVSFEQSLATLTTNWWHFIISVLVTLWQWYQACPDLLHASVAHWTLQCDAVVFKLVNKQLNNNDFIQGELYWFSTFSTKYCSKSAFFGVFANFDDFAQKCMHSAKSSISFGTLIFYCVHQNRLTILHTPTKP